MSDADKLRALQQQMADHKKLCAKCNAAKLKADQYCDLGYVIARAHHAIKRRMERAAEVAASQLQMLPGMTELGG